MIENPRTEEIIVYCSEKEKIYIRQCAKNYKMTMSLYLLEMHRSAQAMRDTKKELVIILFLRLLFPAGPSILFIT